MEILVSDTSVLIDCHRAALIEHIFQLPYSFVVPDLLYVRELAPEFGARLPKLGLKVMELSPSPLASAQRYHNKSRKLSLPDCFALALAEDHGWVLLTGDKSLRATASGAGIGCHGILWLLDQLETHSTASPAELHAGLTAIARHPRCRLPRREINLRLARYTIKGQ